MAYGSAGQSGSTGGPSTAFVAGSAVPSGNSSGGSSGNSIAPVMMFFILLGLYVIWALVERHEKVRQAVEPHSIGINLRNLAVIVLPVILMIPLLKIAAGKYQALGLPGGSTVTAYFGSV